jgi:predicted protein tyrosine phosphatase
MTSRLLLTICGLEELDYHSARGVTHVLSIIDPDWPEPESLWAFDPHCRLTLRFHDTIEPREELTLPTRDDVEAILKFGRSLKASGPESDIPHLLVHCHAGVSRSTAAVAILLAQANPQLDEDEVFVRLIMLRPKAWPNSLMIAFADELLEREGRLTDALCELYAHQLKRDPNAKRLLRMGGRAREVDMALALRKSQGLLLEPNRTS